MDTLPDTTTIRGLERYIELWLDEGQLATSQHLRKACQGLVGKLEKAITDTEAELATTGETDRSLAEPVECCIVAYERMRDVLQDLKVAAVKEQRGEARLLADELHEAADFLAQAQNDLSEWLQKPVPRCPKCGGSEGDPCPNCHLELLILDPQGGTDLQYRTATLPEDYSRVFEVINAVRNGEATFGKLLEVLPPVESSLKAYLASLQAIQKESDSELLPYAQSLLMEIRAGIDHLKAVQETRRVTDLQQGWLHIFTHAEKFEELRLPLMEELGGDTGADLAARQRALQGQQDSVTISGLD